MEITALVCRRVAEGPPEVRSTVDKCCVCDNAVWVANSSPEVDRVLCMICTLAETRKARENGDKVELMPPTEEQRREIEEYIEGEG